MAATLLANVSEARGESGGNSLVFSHLQRRFRYLILRDDLTENTVLTWDRSSQRHKHHGGHGVSEADGAAEVRRQISNDGGEEANDADGHQEAGPTVPVLRGWNAGKQNLPENGEKVHDVIIAGGKAVPSAFLVIVTIA